MVEKTNEEKIEWLKKNINYYCYMKILERKFTEKQLEELYDQINSPDGEWIGGNFIIRDLPQGERDCDIKLIEVWVDQIENGGYEGDSFSGDIYVKLNDKEYLVWSYAC